MTKTKITALSIIAGLLIMAFTTAFTIVGTLNSYSRLENLAKAVQVDNGNVLDNTRKSIREAGGVSDREVEALAQIITGYAESRGANNPGDGAAVTVGMVREAVPGVTEIKTLNNLQNIIVSGRKDWQHSQTRLLDIKRQADDMIATFPSGMILRSFGKNEIEVVTVTSSETKENFRTGEDNSNWIEQ
jgi:hypothetical protein